MKELSLNILDIAMNSVKAGATRIGIDIDETDDKLDITIRDDGCGMDAETVRRLSDPFFTTRTTRRVGLGVPFYTLAAQQTGGDVQIHSVPAPAPDHGTTVRAVFIKTHIDFTPLGDIISTLTTLIHGYPNIDLEFRHKTGGTEITLSTSQIRAMLGDDIPINSLEILDWIRDYLSEQYANRT